MRPLPYLFVIAFFYTGFSSTMLFSAPSILNSVQEGDFKAVQKWVKEGKDLNLRYYEKSVLQYAIEEKQAQIALYLIQKKISLEEESIVSAIRTKQLKLVQALIHSGIKLSGNLVYEAAKINSIDILSLLLKKNIDVNQTDPQWGKTALHCAVSHENIPMILLLLKHQAYINQTNSTLITPFHFAAAKQNKELLEILLKNKADIQALDLKGNSAIHYAAGFSTPAIIDWMITHGFSIHLKNKHGSKPIHIAALQDNLDNFKYLIRLGADIHEKNLDGETPIYMAYKYQFYGAVKNYLVTLGYNYNLNQVNHYKLDLKKAQEEEEKEKQEQKSIQRAEMIGQIMFGYILPASYLTLSIYSREKSYKNNPEDNPLGLINGFTGCLILGGFLGAGLGMQSQSGNKIYSGALNTFIGGTLGVILGGALAFLTAKEANKNSAHYYSATAVLVLFPVLMVHW